MRSRCFRSRSCGSPLYVCRKSQRDRRQQHGQPLRRLVIPGWQNTAAGGWPPGGRYELDLADGSGVQNCHVNGDLIDLNRNIDEKKNVFGCKDPEFDEAFVPRAAGFDGVGYRPVASQNHPH